MIREFPDTHCSQCICIHSIRFNCVLNTLKIQPIIVQWGKTVPTGSAASPFGTFLGNKLWESEPVWPNILSCSHCVYFSWEPAHSEYHLQHKFHSSSHMKETFLWFEQHYWSKTSCRTIRATAPLWCYTWNKKKNHIKLAFRNLD